MLGLHIIKTSAAGIAISTGKYWAKLRKGRDVTLNNKIDFNNARTFLSNVKSGKNIPLPLRNISDRTYIQLTE